MSRSALGAALRGLAFEQADDHGHALVEAARGGLPAARRGCGRAAAASTRNCTAGSAGTPLQRRRRSAAPRRRRVRSAPACARLDTTRAPVHRIQPVALQLARRSRHRPAARPGWRCGSRAAARRCRARRGGTARRPSCSRRSIDAGQCAASKTRRAQPGVGVDAGLAQPGARQVQAAVARVLADVAGDVGQLHRHAQLAGAGQRARRAARPSPAPSSRRPCRPRARRSRAAPRASRSGGRWRPRGSLRAARRAAAAACRGGAPRCASARSASLRPGRPA